MLVRSMKRKPRVLIKSYNRFTFGREIVQSIQEYVHKHLDWDIDIWTTPFNLLIPRERFQCYDGLIGYFCKEDLEAFIPLVETGRLKAVNFHLQNIQPGVQQITFDHYKIGRLGARHLIEQNMERLYFAACGHDLEHSIYTILRYRGFREQAEAMNIPVKAIKLSTAMFRSSRGYLHQNPRIYNEFGDEFGKGAGMMCNCDPLGAAFILWCNERGIGVPEDMAVVAVGNDELMTHCASPTLSSIDKSARTMGIVAAKHLELMMNGEENGAPVLVPPERVVKRESSDRHAVTYPDIVKSIEYIESNYTNFIDINSLLSHLDISRSTFERRFKAVMKTTPLSYILRKQLDKAKELLKETKLPLAEVADRSGFSNARYFGVIFKKKTGMTPCQFRSLGD